MEKPSGPAGSAEPPGAHPPTGLAECPALPLAAHGPARHPPSLARGYTAAGGAVWAKRRHRREALYILCSLSISNWPSVTCSEVYLFVFQSAIYIFYLLDWHLCLLREGKCLSRITPFTWPQTSIVQASVIFATILTARAAGWDCWVPHQLCFSTRVKHIGAIGRTARKLRER